MKRKFIIVSILCLGFLAGCSKTTNQTAYTEPSPTQEKPFIDTQTIVMKPGGFEPSSITVKKNTKVIFKNEDTQFRWPASNIHPTHGIYPEFDPLKGIPSGQEWSFVFDKVGTWKFHDHLWPTLIGDITVTE